MNCVWKMKAIEKKGLWHVVKFIDPLSELLGKLDLQTAVAVYNTNLLPKVMSCRAVFGDLCFKTGVSIQFPSIVPPLASFNRHFFTCLLFVSADQKCDTQFHNKKSSLDIFNRADSSKVEWTPWWRHFCSFPQQTSKESILIDISFSLRTGQINALAESR